MTSAHRHTRRRSGPRPALAPAPAPRGTTRRFAAVAGLIAFALAMVFSIAPPPPASQAQVLAAYISHHAQSLSVSGALAEPAVKRDRYSATSGIETFVSHGTNQDWAALVLLTGGWPTSDANITVLTRWMRQENGPNNWWNRNNPLNNGWGSGGGGGTGSYPNLVVAAQKAAEALHRNPGYGGIVAALAASAPTNVTEQAIWASPWSTSHYANGTHWSQAPVPAFKAPASAW
jgi:hypothetical protein